MTEAETPAAPAHPWARFLAAGTVNTLLSVAVYQGALFVVGHVAAYVAAYASGIAFAYYAYSRHVFFSSLSFRRLAAFTGFYLASLACGSLLNAVLIERGGLHARIAIFATVALMLPVNYYGSRWCVRIGTPA